MLEHRDKVAEQSKRRKVTIESSVAVNIIFVVLLCFKHRENE